MADFTSCPQCQTRYRTAGMPVGKRLRCRKCRTVFTIQEDAASTPTIQKPADEKAEADALPAGMGQQSSLSVAGVHGGVVLGQDKPVVESLTAATGDEKCAVEDEIARGGMGAILKAVDRNIRRPVAMKVMLDAKSPKDKARFVEKAQVTGQLEHPNIVPIHELGIDAEGRLFFTMKLVKGKSLGDVLKALKKNDAKAEQDYPLGRLLNAFINICNAMAFAHAKGIVHRDLKPANIMLGDYGEVLVMDWGLAKPGAAAPRALAPGGRGQREAPGEGDDADVDSDSRDRELAEAVKSLRQETSGELTMDLLPLCG